MKQTKIYTINLKNKVYDFNEDIYEISKTALIKNIHFSYKSYFVKLKFFSNEHNPPHVHISFNDNSNFRFKIEQQEFYLSDIKNNETFQSFKNNKLIFEIILIYLNERKQELIESFYLLNPTLKTQ